MDLHLFSICSAGSLMQQNIYLADAEKCQYWYDLVWDIVCSSETSLWKKKINLSWNRCGEGLAE